MSKQFASNSSDIPAMLIEVRRLIDTGQQREALAMISKVEAAGDFSEGDLNHNRLLSLKSIALHGIADYNEALDVARTALQAVIGSSENELIAELQATSARCLTELGQTGEAWHMYRDLVSTYRRLDDTVNVIRTLNRLSRIHFIRGDFDRAVTVLIEAEDHARRIDSDKWMAMIHGNLGTIFNLTGEFGKAVDYLQESIVRNRRLKAELNLCRAHLSLAFALMHLKKFETADQSLATAERLALQLDSRPEIAMLHQYRAQMALLQDDPSLAMSEARRAKAHATAGSAEDCQISRLIASAELRLGNLDEAARQCRYALDLARLVGEKVEEAACLRIKAELAHKNQAARQVVKDLLNNSIEILQANGSQYELAQSWAIKSKLAEDYAISREYGRRSYGILAMLGLSDRPEKVTGNGDGHDMIPVIGEDPEFRKVIRDADLCAESDISVLLLGQTGAGKDQVAKFIHHLSPRKSGPFVAVNCGAIPPELAESEFFGYEKGAFTNAAGTKKGLLEAARGGTLFLNEVGELPLALQVKLLSALDEKEFYRLGGTTPRSVDFRIIAATNVNLHEAVAAGKFRADLFYRLNVMTLQVPRLADRGDDVFLLFEYFLAKSGLSLSTVPASLREDLLEDMRSYSWPGNVRELKNYIDLFTVTEKREVRAICRRLQTKLEELKAASAGAIAADQVDLKREMAEYEENLIRRALEICDGVKRRAADYLGVPEGTLRSKMKKYRIQAA